MRCFEPWLAVVIAAESFAICTEALWGRLFHVIANFASAGTGFLLYGLRNDG